MPTPSAVVTRPLIERGAAVGLSTAFENSDVLGVGEFVAVAVDVTVPAVPPGGLKAKSAFPEASVVTITVPIYVFPSPKPDASTEATRKKSISNIVFGVEFKVPVTVE